MGEIGCKGCKKDRKIHLQSPLGSSLDERTHPREGVGKSRSHKVCNDFLNVAKYSYFFDDFEAIVRESSMARLKLFEEV